NRGLTLNYGVRWEPYTAVYQSRTAQGLHFDPTVIAQNVHSTIYKYAPAGLAFSGDPQYSWGNSFNCPKRNKFFPRVGLAWDPEGNGRMTIRAAYGMFGDRMSMLSLSQEQFGAPFGSTVSVSGSTLTNPWANYPGGAGGLLPPGQNPMSILAARSGFGYVSPDVPFVTFGSYISSPLKDFNPMYTNQWNVSIQRQVGQDWLFTANYLGTSTIHFPSGQVLNAPQFLGLGPCTLQTPSGPVNYTTCSTTANQNFRRPLYMANPALGQFYSGIGLLDDGGTATYDGLNLSAQKRMSHGVNILANYTWSHCISDQWFQNPTAGNGNSIPGARRAWRSNCVGIDLRQLFQLSVVATSPKFSNRALRWIAGDWQIAPNMQIKSAQFFSVLSGTDRALTAVPGQPASLVNANPYPSHQTVDHWLHPASFAQPALGTYGNLGLNNLKGPSVFQLDLALSRNFPIKEKQYFQLRAEAFNLPNHLNAFTPGIAPINQLFFGGQQNLNAPNFGQITNDISGNGGGIAGDYRVVQLVGKFVF